MPPAPFEFTVNHTDFRVIFTDYGRPIRRQDASECIRDAITEIGHEIDTHTTEIDEPIPGNLVFTSGSAELHLNTARYMLRTLCLSLMVGLLEWGWKYGYIEVDMEFVEEVGMLRRTLGTGSLFLSGAAS